MTAPTALGRGNYCHTCDAAPGRLCVTATGRRTSDHAARVHGIGPDLPPSSTHVDAPVCRCLPCHDVRRREARHAARPARLVAVAARAAARREATRMALIEAAAAEAAERRAAEAAAAAREAAERARGGGHPATVAPCYVCSAPIGVACPDRPKPHPERGRYGSWAYRPQRPDAALPERPRVARVIDVAQPALLPPTRRPARRTAA